LKLSSERGREAHERISPVNGLHSSQPAREANALTMPGKKGDEK
jgi:hypothetical protein